MKKQAFVMFPGLMCFLIRIDATLSRCQVHAHNNVHSHYSNECNISQHTLTVLPTAIVKIGDCIAAPSSTRTVYIAIIHFS